MTADPKAIGLPKRIVVIDDSLTLRKFIEAALSIQPFVSQLLIAENARTGLELVFSTKPDLVICDLTMPDRKGDEVCEELLHNAETMNTPVILMSSECDEIAAIQKRLPNIHHVIVKPFTRQLLIATVGYVIKSRETAQATASVVAAASKIAFRGSSSTFPLTNALQAVETRKLTGILLLASDRLVVNAYCREGTVACVSTRSVEVYLEGTPYQTLGRKTALWQTCENKQRETLCPFLLNLADLGGLAELTATTLSEFYGQKLFARLWKENDVSFEFEETALPAFTSRMKSHSSNMSAWIISTLRYVEGSDEMSQMLNDPLGVPVLTPAGHRKLNFFQPNRQDKNILSMLDGSMRLIDICEHLHIPPDDVANRLFCYRQLGFVDYWPSEVLEHDEEPQQHNIITPR